MGLPTLHAKVLLLLHNSQVGLLSTHAARLGVIYLYFVSLSQVDEFLVLATGALVRKGAAVQQDEAAAAAVPPPPPGLAVMTSFSADIAAVCLGYEALMVLAEHRSFHFNDHFTPSAGVGSGSSRE